jgi:hypothetical protein
MSVHDENRGFDFFSCEKEIKLPYEDARVTCADAALQASEDLAPAIDRAAKAVGNNGRENLAGRRWKPWFNRP